MVVIIDLDECENSGDLIISPPCSSISTKTSSPSTSALVSTTIITPRNLFNHWGFLLASSSHDVSYPKTLLTTDIIESEILPRLDLEDVYRFKVVSKQWHSIFESKYFKKLNVEYSETKNHNMSILEEPLYLGGNMGGYMKLDLLTWNNLLSPRLTCTGKLEIRGHFHLVGSIRGVVCLFLREENKFWIWNPVTMNIREIMIDNDDDHDDGPVRAYGFGYNGQDYLITVCYRTSIFKVFSLTNETWERIVPEIDNFTGNEINLRGFFANNNLYWGWDDGDHLKGLIKFSMLEKEVIPIEIPRPNYPSIVQNVWGINDVVYVYCRLNDEKSDLWKLVDDSWELVFPIMNEDKDGFILGPVTTENKLLVHKRGYVGVWDLERKIFIGDLIWLDKKRTYFTAIPYYPSLEEF